MKLPREIIKIAFSKGVVTDKQCWIDMIHDRHLAAHAYDEQRVRLVVSHICRLYVPAIGQLNTYFLMELDNNPPLRADMFGLNDNTMTKIINCLSQFPTIHWVKIYGSRAKGTFQPGSDIDLAFSSTEDISARLLAELGELPTPYLFDVTHYESLQHEGLKEHIDTVGQIIYTG